MLYLFLYVCVLGIFEFSDRFFPSWKKEYGLLTHMGDRVVQFIFLMVGLMFVCWLERRQTGQLQELPFWTIIFLVIAGHGTGKLLDQLWDWIAKRRQSRNTP